jgi:AAHS family 4-hydroxybenzoate transporter-like MFS transporter
VAAALALALALRPALAEPAILALFGALGLFLLSAQIALFALAAHVYPAEIRGTGFGGAAGVGRIGAIFAAWFGVHLATQGPLAFFGGCAACLAVILAVTAGITRHSVSD